MTQPPPTTTPSTYTTIPISAADVISRSVQNFSSSFTLHLRPWPQLFTSGSFSRPDSFSTSLTRLRSNFHYFKVNYSIIISASAALSLIGSPISLFIFAFILSLWLLLHFFREDPLVLLGYHVNDRFVLIGLVLVSVLVVWLSGSFWNLVWGILIGFFVCGVHAVFRNVDESLVLSQEGEALIGSGHASGSYGTVSVSGGDGVSGGSGDKFTK